MYIKSIKIFDIYNEKGKCLQADFFNDLTILIGKNGSGKTTVLNILSCIISGNIVFLKDYKFSKVEILYDGKKDNDTLLINKYVNLEKEIIINIKFDGEDIDIPISSVRYGSVELNEYVNYIANKYEILKKIKDTFNQFYLPMNRYTDYSMGMVKYQFARYYDDDDRKKNPFSNYLNDAMLSIIKLLKNYISRMNIMIDNKNKEFRKDIINVLSDLTIDFPSAKDVKHVLGTADYQRNQEEFINALKNNGIDDKDKEKSVNNFFNILKMRDSEEYDKNSDTFINYVWQLTQYTKIIKVSNISFEFDKDIKNITFYKDSFVRMINEYFAPKRVAINDEGDVSIELLEKKIDLDDLSSGEKQLFITIASLFFGIAENENSIFIIDEPESSLHVDWQEKFTESIVSINKNIQIIIATHSPEILGKYIDKIYMMGQNQIGNY